MSRKSSGRFAGSTRLLLLSIVFHVVYIKSIFDIYFQSPVIHVSKRWNVLNALDEGLALDYPSPALAKRVVLIVADGLRADKLFQCYADPPFSTASTVPAGVSTFVDNRILCNGKRATTPAPFLRSLIQDGKARWGISHTRVPTESRPGHVALIGGMYEDVSAVTRGWQHNPVPFDSVFNQSTVTWSFGSPDILPMFRDGASDPNRVKTWTYGKEFEDFTKDAVHLDLWVLDKVKELLRTTEPKQYPQASVFFLHLLGLDTTGHSYRPHGTEYHRNIRVVDHVAREVTAAIDSYFDDHETAYIFTADHGMSNKGNHGDGEPDNTRTPLVTWGAGINTDLRGSGIVDSLSRDWDLRGPRVDVDQADVANLMAVLDGLNIPANSAGRVPLSYIKASPEFKARAMLANARQVLEQYEAKRNRKAQTAIRFKPFKDLVDGDGTRSEITRLDEIRSLVQQRRWTDAEQQARDLYDVAAKGLEYFTTYDWLLLRSIVSAGYISFMVYMMIFLRRGSLPRSVDKASSSGPILASVAFTSFCVRFFIEDAPLVYYVYTAFPCFFAGSILLYPSRLAGLVRATRPSQLITLLLVAGILQALVESFQRREILAALIAICTSWTIGLAANKHRSLSVIFAGLSAVLAVFPLLPVEKGESVPAIIAGGVVSCVAAGIAREFCASEKSKTFVGHEISLIIGGTLVTVSSALSLQRKLGLPPLNQVGGWFVLGASALVPILYGAPSRDKPLDRMAVVLLSFCPAFVLLSLSYEAIFYVVYASTLVVWSLIETRLHDDTKEKAGTLSMDHVRIAVLFLVYLMVGFFGVGNIASISSFYLEPVYRLMTVFAPFAMGALLLYKLLIPFVALSAVTNVINRRLALPPFALFILASLMTEVLTLNFFFRVKNTGSWLEIGSTITNFVICSALSIFNTGLYLLGEVMMARTE